MGGVLKDDDDEEDTVRLSNRPKIFSKLLLSFSNADAKRITDWALFPPMATEEEDDGLYMSMVISKSNAALSRLDSLVTIREDAPLSFFGFWWVVNNVEIRCIYSRWH